MEQRDKIFTPIIDKLVDKDPGQPFLEKRDRQIQWMVYVVRTNAFPENVGFSNMVSR